ncbi:Oxaloacetate decarboxylase, gamma chain [Saccharicrinis carchari]|uniref:Oxaloacetate decarboxylase, gamma chain n=1 Tax=Saccharicrinis carchari TaxID=1168039 RepID=A0A521BVI2_SACCC|nr:OadG family protein [Saccharicrinis carchari]SMO51179.1 Oxaloacetate decarboxylase, gamma chain [Saccharicrinis carchari]
MIFLFVNDATWTITLLGWAIVLLALVFLMGIFLLVPKVIKWGVKRSLRSKGKTEIIDHHLNISGETNAAIATALHLYFNQIHDEESNVITIKRVRRRYSPWSSKLYGMNNMGFRR